MRLRLQSSYAAASQRHFEKFKTENRGTEGANGSRWRHTTTCNEMFLICFLIGLFLTYSFWGKKTQLRNPHNNDDHNNNEKEEQEEKPRTSGS